jgi:drug/metabolite transporter (DMT)-like permease
VSGHDARSPQSGHQTAGEDGPGRVLGPLSPAWAMALGALGVSASASCIDLAGTTPGTASFCRCVLALPLLWVLVRSERGREGSLSRRRVAVAVAAGALFAGDALLWTQAIFEVGA